MFDLSLLEILVVLAVALIAVKPEDLPGLAKTVVRLFRKVKSAVKEVQDTMAEIRDEADVSADIKDVQEELTEITDLDGKTQYAYDPDEIKALEDPKTRGKPTPSNTDEVTP